MNERAGESLKNRIVIKSSKAGMTIILDSECSFEELIAELTAKFRNSARFWGNAKMALSLQGRPLSAAQEMQIVNSITENSDIEVICLLDQDLERVERCEKALDRKFMELSLRTGEFYQGDLHRGDVIESEGSIVIIGDVRHGARVTAKGHILVMGELRGSVHAGSGGNMEAVVAAMEMVPLQIRISDVSCHYGDKGRKLGRGPMIAFVENCCICTKVIKKSLLNMLNFN